MSLSISPSPIFLSGPTEHLFLTRKLSHLSLHTTTTTRRPTMIRMGGGPRTFPGGVSKWQWKRMQANKAKQLLKARLARERQIYEMRKRAELKAAVSELERPWEVVKQAPKLFSVAADEQVKVLADRFQKPGGFDMWSEKDGPQVLSPVDEVPSARFFPKGVIHSIKPYGKVDKDLDDVGNLYQPGSISESVNGNGRNGLIVNGTLNSSNGKLRIKGKRIRSGGENLDGLNGFISGEVGGDGEQRTETLARCTGNNQPIRGRGSQKLRVPNSEASDMSFEDDGLRKKGKRIRYGVRNLNALYGLVPGGVGVDGEQRKETPARRTGNTRPNRGRGSQKLRGPSSEVFDMSLQDDGLRKKGKKIVSGFENSNNLNGFVLGGVGTDGKQRRETPARRGGNNRFTRGRGWQKSREPNSEVFDMSLQHDGSYGFQAEK
ncbi:uncharacterized protein LOC131325737 [Rhododendron vialii]|uniref:uncharacterized protein LOC131325737 n=1 Tax=Rhododendron vialii TaxID=182163 RepID=UPI00265E030F|nr:uncharacterized protein LOC131325737 [Rhododendron vialii]